MQRGSHEGVSGRSASRQWPPCSQGRCSCRPRGATEGAAIRPARQSISRIRPLGLRTTVKPFLTCKIRTFWEVESYQHSQSSAITPGNYSSAASMPRCMLVLYFNDYRGCVE